MIRRLELIEDRLKEESETRHERNSRIISIVEEERLARMELAKTVKSIEKSIEELRQMHRDVLESLKGNWSHAGVVSNVRDHDARIDKTNARIKKVEDDFAARKSFFAGIVMAVGAVGSAIGAGIAILAEILFGR